MKRYSLTRVKLTALYKHLITKTTLAYISANKTLIIVAINKIKQQNVSLGGKKSTTQKTKTKQQQQKLNPDYI